MAFPPAPVPGAPPGGAPPPGAGAPPPGGPGGQPPIGGSPATGPTQNLGQEAKQLQAAGAVLSAIHMVVALAPTSEIGKAFSECGMKLGKMVPPGAASPQGQKNFGQQMLMQQHQMAPQVAAMRAQGGPPGAGGAPPPGAAPPGGAPPPPGA